MTPNNNGQVDWQHCVDTLTDEGLLELSHWRGYSIECCRWLREKGYIGLYLGGFAFPVRNLGETLLGVHYLHGEPTKKNWRYSHRATSEPLVIGNLEVATQAHLFESQWDAIAYLSVTGDYLNPQIAVIATRGASNGLKVRDLLYLKSELFLWPQNDLADPKTGQSPSEKWVNQIKSSVGRDFFRVPIPRQYKDLNDWTRAGATAEAIQQAIQSALPISAPEIGSEENEKPWNESLDEGSCTSLELSSLSLAPREALIDIRCNEADLGFIFAKRGVGKTMLGMHLGHGLATKTDVGPWKIHKSVPVLYLDGEMPSPDIKQRDHALGKPTENLTYINHEILSNAQEES
jgi:hypothetical protein